MSRDRASRPSPGPAGAAGHLPNLDGARGLAALAVVADHLGHYGFLPGWPVAGLGAMGVILFYALSGFLMGHLYLHRPFGAGAVRTYAVSRLSRVLPLFYAAIAGGLVLLALFGASGYAFATARDVLRNALLIEGTGVLWSVPVEVHFYLLFVLLWLGASRGRLVGAALGLLLVCGLVGAAVWGAAPGHRYVVYYVHVFLAGCALARLRRGRPGLFAAAAAHPAVSALAWAMPVLLLAAMPAVRAGWGQTLVPIFLDPVTVGFPLLFLALALLGAGPFRALGWWPLRWLGSISYSLYLLHMPLIFLVVGSGIPGAMPLPVAAALTLAAALLVAWASVRLIERPAQARLKARFLPMPSRPPVPEDGAGRPRRAPAPPAP